VLFPALHNLAKQELLSREFAVVGVARSPDVERRFSQENF
jgi:glucose-6-phosphate 1-dehydrogenase